MAKIKFNLVYRINTHCINKEYCYQLEVISNSGKKYLSYDNWISYQPDAKSAKSDILSRINENQSFDYVLDDILIKDEFNNPFFVNASI